jgi:hypothetical protein
MRKPEQVEHAVVTSRMQSTLTRGGRWSPYGVGQGYAGLSLLWGYLGDCYPGEDWDLVAHEHLEIAARAAAATPMRASSLFSGLSGVAFAAHLLSRGGARYRRLLEAADLALLPLLRDAARTLDASNGGMPVHLFDVISGLSGAARYLLLRSANPEAARMLEQILRSLVAMTLDAGGAPRWRSTVDQLGPEEQLKKAYPHGNLNCGLAHGIPGPLALLSLARSSGVGVEGMDEAIERIAGWLAANRVDDESGANWPTAIPIEADGAGWKAGPPSSAPFGPSHAGWCYGSPGVARALWLAGEALDRDDYRGLAVEAVEAILRRTPEQRRIESPTFCHGIAGLLQIVARFANETGHAAIQEGARTLCGQLFALHDPQTLLGYRSIELRGARVDQPGLLDGAPGVALVLLAAAHPVEPAWDALFLLS